MLAHWSLKQGLPWHQQVPEWIVGTICQARLVLCTCYPTHGRETEAGAPGQPGGHISLEEDRERGCWAPSPRNFLCVLRRLTEESNSRALCTDGLGVGLSPLLETGPWMSQSLRTCFLHSRGGAVRIK